MKPLKILALLLFVTLLQGCIYENDDDCPPKECTVTLKFEYPDFPAHITRVNLGLFDEEGLFVELMQVSKSDLDRFQGVVLSLQPGKYTSVCWANAFDNTLIKGFSKGMNITEGQVVNPNYETTQPITSNDSLFYGKKEFSVLNQQTQTYTVDFTPAYIRFIITIKGLSSTAQQNADNYPYIRINNLKPAYNFNMDAIGPNVSYYPLISVNTAEKIAFSVTNVIRFATDNPITIDVLKNKTSLDVLTSLDLRQFMIDNDIKIVAGKKVTIPLLFTFFNNDLDVSVSIDRWGEIPINPEI